MSGEYYPSLREAIEQSGFAWKAEALIKAATPAIRLKAERIGMDSIPIGSSRMGGLPDLPPQVAWPDIDGRPLEFLAQINFAEAAAVAQLSGLPRSGWLIVFYDLNQRIAHRRDVWRGLFFDADPATLRRLDPGDSGKRGLRAYGSFDDAPQQEDFHACALRMERWFCPPEEHVFLAAGIEGGGDPMDEWLDLEDLLDFTGDPIHLLGGVPMQVQEAPNPSHSSHLLLQISSDLDGPGWMWGDMGRMYFLTTEKGLAARDFSQVQASWDSY